MLTLSSKKNEPVNAVCLIDMRIEGEECAAGDVVLLPKRDFVFLSLNNRVVEATKENIASAKAQAEQRRKVALETAARFDALDNTKAQLAAAHARIAELEKKGK